VVTEEPSATSAGVRQPSTGSPSSSTRHAPHSPSPQPSFAAVRPSRSRSTNSRLSATQTSGTSTGSPFTVQRIDTVANGPDAGGIGGPATASPACWTWLGRLLTTEYVLLPASGSISSSFEESAERKSY
jgi:hypothetical protein